MRGVSLPWGEEFGKIQCTLQSLLWQRQSSFACRGMEVFVCTLVLAVLTRAGISFPKGGTNRAFALEWKDTTGSKWYCLLWVTWRELQCCAILFPKLDFLKVAFIVWFSHLSQQLQSAGIAQELSDPTAQREVCKTLLVPWNICVFAVSGCFFPNPQLQLCHCSWSLSSSPVTAGLQPQSGSCGRWGQRKG